MIEKTEQGIQISGGVTFRNLGGGISAAYLSGGYGCSTLVGYVAGRKGDWTAMPATIRKVGAVTYESKVEGTGTVEGFRTKVEAASACARIAQYRFNAEQRAASI